MAQNDYSEFLKAADAAARKVHSSKAKNMITNHVWNAEKGKYVKVKRYRSKTAMTKKEEREFFGHTFTFKQNILSINRGETTLLFDKNHQLCDILPFEDDTKEFLDAHRGQPYQFFVND
jgi:hypothetical protein|nr:MAG TPA_asm: hypothetical protein [Bacteriophage sp.]